MAESGLQFFVGILLLILLAACAERESPAQASEFCANLARVNNGAVDTTGLSELEGHARVVASLLPSSPPGLHSDLQRIHETIAAWAEVVAGEQEMLDVFELLGSPELIGAQGRVSDYVAVHCGLRLGGKAWKQTEAPGDQSICPAWPRLGTPLTFNHFPNLPDIAGSNYFGQNFLVSRWLSWLGVKTVAGAFVVAPGGKVVISGQYPRARYFAFHPNDADLNNLKTLRDKDLEPDSGSRNPYREERRIEGEHYYTANLVFTPPPAVPEANTSYVGLRKDGIRDNPFVLNLLRMYHVDAGNIAASGGVPLPALDIYDGSGKLQQRYEACDLFAPGVAEIRNEQVFPSLPILDHRAQKIPRWSTSSNFEAPSDTLANADVQYLSTTFSERFGELFVVRAKYLSAPDTRNGDSPGAGDRQVRLYNLCTYNFWNGGANHCLLENDLLLDESGFYTLVISREENRPDNLEASSASWMNWGPFLDGQLSYRFVFRENPIIAAIAGALDGRGISAELADYVPRAVPCNKSVYQRGGWKACLLAARTDP